MNRYIVNSKEVYTLELEKLQRCFLEITQIAEGISDVTRVGWKQVEYLRQMNFILAEAMQIGEIIVGPNA